jgi:hypothetical protein
MSSVRWLAHVGAVMHHTRFALVMSFALGCSTEEVSATSCNDEPAICPRGQTCWRTNDKPDYPFQCLPSGTGKKGEACDTSDGAGNYGPPACQDGLICETTVSTIGVCVPYCPAKTKPGCGCASGEQCVTVHAAAPDPKGRGYQYCACLLAGMLDAGTDGGADAGTR